MASPMKRRESDLMKLMMNNYKVDLIDGGNNKFHVYMKGPPNSPYSGGLWKVCVELPVDYPYSSPSVGFVNRIYHPNIDERYGIVCLDVLNERWSPMFDLVHVFEIFLPQLLIDPNPFDPLNKEAANLLLGGDTTTYEQRVREYCERYAKPEDMGVVEHKETSDGEVSEDGGDTGDEAMTSGPVDPR